MDFCKISIIFVLFAGLASAEYLAKVGDVQFLKDDRAFENELRELLERFRETILNGDPEKGIPVLDPYFGEELSFNVTIPDTALLLFDMYNATALGLGSFVVDAVNFSPLSLRFDFGFTLPKINISAEYYELDGDLIDDSFELEGNGTFDLSVSTVEMVGYAKLTIREGHLYMNDFYIAIDIDRCISDTTGLLDGGDQCVLLNQVVQQLVPALVVSRREQLSALLGELVMDYANTFLPELTLQDLIDLITGGGNRTTTTPSIVVSTPTALDIDL